MKDMIAGKLNQRLKADIVKNIFFMVGRVQAGSGAADAAALDGGADLAAVNDEFLDTIVDAEIRAAFQKLLRSYARQRPRRRV
jgi:hypothetical protein